MSCSNLENSQFGWVCDVARYTSQILGKLIPFLEVAALLMLLYAVYLYMTARGDQNKINISKNIVISILFVSILMFVVELLVHFIEVR